ncbi:hypothetical protein LGZ99_23830 [Photorhabdus temperata]|uniref:Uncharacterized protein n=2 Tax=Photorhabdus temperata TaxID=574560 RepID=A0A081RQX3_PHOTE|nr:hypothetical protein [Photorhabdus temperata]EQB98544.1 hypothetical protein B738_23915 [Photorhabdus temperata subsp. temperata M1021]ERT12709.1 hypothetical protein O185_12620 [Photorhabdus temperata J3]KER01076.1 hypothetical protein MEG1DRAFT_04347 [Photorhabdus temperata subsp. temperata Meg1]MCT8350140.1 hypothetical protein [Photorhabdus temperata]
MSKSLMDTATFWEITKYLLQEEHGNNIRITITELDDMIDKTIRSAVHIAQMVSHEIKQREEGDNDKH